MGQASSADDPFTQNTSQSFNIPARVRSVPIAETFDSGRFAIPPRRVLPFAKAKPKEKVTLPKPAPTKDIEPTAPGCATPTRKPAKKRAAQRKPSVAKAQENGFATNTFAAATLDDLPSPLAIKKSTEATPKVTATKKRATPVSRPSSASKRPKMVDAGTQTQTPSGCDQSVQTIPPPTKAPELVKNVSTPPSPESPPEHYLDGVDKFVSKVCPPTNGPLTNYLSPSQLSPNQVLTSLHSSVLALPPENSGKPLDMPRLARRSVMPSSTTTSARTSKIRTSSNFAKIPRELGVELDSDCNLLLLI